MKWFDSIVEFFQRLFGRNNDPKPEPIDPEPVDPVKPDPDPKPETEEDNFVPAALYAPRYDAAGAVEIRTSGGFKWNAENSRKRGKSIWPTKYIRKIAWVTYFDGNGFQEVAKRAFPNEGGPRARFYGSLLTAMPTEIMCRAHIVNGDEKDVYVRIPDTKKTWQ